MSLITEPIIFSVFIDLEMDSAFYYMKVSRSQWRIVGKTLGSLSISLTDHTWDPDESETDSNNNKHNLANNAKKDPIFPQLTHVCLDTNQYGKPTRRLLSFLKECPKLD